MSQLEMRDAMFRYATEGILICDNDGVIQLTNPAVRNMFGYEENDLKGQKIEVLLPQRHRRAHIGMRTDYSRRPEPRKMGYGRDLFATKKDGTEIMVEVSLSPFKTSVGDFIMCFIVDITQRKKNEIELNLAHERLKQTSDALSSLNAELENKVRERTEELADAINRLADSKVEVMRALEREKELNELKSRFVTTASHEFRTPLGTILSSASLIARYEEPGDAEKRKKHTERIKAAVGNLTEILNDFLSLEKLEEGIVRSRPEKTDFSQLVREVTDDMKGISKKGQDIILEYKGDREISIDRQLIRNAMINLIANAIKYSPEKKPVHVHITVGKARLQMSVADQGIGIPDEDQENIFERFFRAKNTINIQGTGLGLNIVKKYVELMDGKISFTSKLNEGTTFNVEIPLNENP